MLHLFVAILLSQFLDRSRFGKVFVVFVPFRHFDELLLVGYGFIIVRLIAFQYFVGGSNF